MLKPYYLEIQAVRITRKNWQKLKELDTGDGVLAESVCNFKDVEGDWFTMSESGNQVLPGNTILIPIKRKPR